MVGKVVFQRFLFLETIQSKIWNLTRFVGKSFLRIKKGKQVSTRQSCSLVSSNLSQNPFLLGFTYAMAPEAGLEPVTCRLTAGCSTD